MTVNNKRNKKIKSGNKKWKHPRQGKNKLIIKSYILCVSYVFVKEREREEREREERRERERERRK